MKKLVLAWAALVLPGIVLAEPERPTPYFVANCLNCHSADGRTVSSIPPLAGRQRAALEEMLKAFKQGTRQATIMDQLAKGYTDEEIGVLADYFSALR